VVLNSVFLKLRPRYCDNSSSLSLVSAAIALIVSPALTRLAIVLMSLFVFGGRPIRFFMSSIILYV
jgi:hypothetical protein